MEINRDSWNRACSFRPVLIREFILYHGPTDAKAAEELCDYAARWGYRCRQRIIKGASLRAWSKLSPSTKVPRWAAVVAARYILQRGWVGTSVEAFEAAMAHLLVELDVITDFMVLYDKEVQHLLMSEVVPLINRLIIED